MSQYTEDLAETVRRMFAYGNRDPHTEEIAREHHGRSRGHMLAVRRELKGVRDILDREQQHQHVCLVGRIYYQEYRGNPPQTSIDARRCLPYGRAGPTVGLYLASPTDDLILQAYIATVLAQGVGKVRKKHDQLVDAVLDGTLSRPQGAAMLQAARDNMLLEDPRKARLIRALLGQP